MISLFLFFFCLLARCLFSVTVSSDEVAACDKKRRLENFGDASGCTAGARERDQHIFTPAIKTSRWLDGYHIFLRETGIQFAPLIPSTPLEHRIPTAIASDALTAFWSLFCGHRFIAFSSGSVNSYQKTCEVTGSFLVVYLWKSYADTRISVIDINE